AAERDRPVCALTGERSGLPSHTQSRPPWRRAQTAIARAAAQAPPPAPPAPPAQARARSRATDCRRCAQLQRRGILVRLLLCALLRTPARRLSGLALRRS